jgi:hypothetical protein
MPNTPPDPDGSPGVSGPEPGGGQDGAQEPGQAWDTTNDWYAQVLPLLSEDPPRIGDFWLDARLAAAESGVVYTAHEDPPEGSGESRAAMVVLLSEGAADDAAARDRFAGLVNAMHIDTVLVRGGHGQDDGRLGQKFQASGPQGDDPVSPDERQAAPWAALVYDGSPAAQAEAVRILDEVQLAGLPPQGRPAGPDYRLYWIDKIRPGLARLWPLPWPGRFDRAGWRTILVSWLLMLLLAALAVLIAILIFQNQPPQTPPPPTGGSGSPPPQSSSPSPQSGSPSPQSGSPSPQSGSPSPQSGSPSPSQSGSGSPSGSPSSASPSPSGSGSPSPSGSESGPGDPSASGAPPTSPTPRSRL